MPDRIVYFSRFMATLEKGGGCRRMMQVRDLLAAEFPDLRLIDQTGGGPVLEKIKERIRVASVRTDPFAPALRSRSLGIWADGHRAAAYRLREFSKAWLRETGDLSGLELAVMDDPVYFRPLLDALVRLGVPVVAVSHNIESLAPLQVRKGRAFDALRGEIDALAMCRLVVTISREETFFLTNLGLPAVYLPDYPSAPVLERLMAVRATRKDSPKKDFLALGNARNVQTREGLDRLGRWWAGSAIGAGTLMLGGFKSAKFLPPVYGPGVEVLGTPDQEALDRILAGIRAFICFQEAGAGVLTRITESLIAGVPVLANGHAARSHYGRKGLVEFDGLDGLAAALSGLGENPADIPVPPAPDPSPIVLRIRRILEAGK